MSCASCGSVSYLCNLLELRPLQFGHRFELLHNVFPVLLLGDEFFLHLLEPFAQVRTGVPEILLALVFLRDVDRFNKLVMEPGLHGQIRIVGVFI